MSRQLHRSTAWGGGHLDLTSQRLLYELVQENNLVFFQLAVSLSPGPVNDATAASVSIQALIDLSPPYGLSYFIRW
jgi:hypothetical protein